MSTRREFITLLGGAAAAWPLAALGEQSAKIYRVAYLALAGDRDATTGPFQNDRSADGGRPAPTK